MFCSFCISVETYLMQEYHIKHINSYYCFQYPDNLHVLQLPQSLCIHLQRKQWTNTGLPYKKYEFVEFLEVLHMSDYVYNSNNSKSLPLRNGLIGGKSVFGYVHANRSANCLQNSTE